MNPRALLVWLTVGAWGIVFALGYGAAVLWERGGAIAHAARRVLP